ncbi:MAG: acetylxylan esterase, partial [Chloroflexota bacterium]|nr:acetylxylan esterase [Chloroflexota bacterium]
AAAYPGLLTLGIERASQYIYRGIVADCLRGAEFLLSRSEVDRSRVGVQGDDLALLTAARRPAFAAVLAEEMLLYRLADAAGRSDAYPAEELNDWVRGGGDRAAAAATLEHFDPRTHAPHITATVMLPQGDDPEWLEPLRSTIRNVETYELTHRGAEDHEWLDAWLARKLGAPARSRFLARV